MRETIETVPSDGNFVILEDDASGSYAVARWSVKVNDWIGENGEPITIVPTHWHPLAGDHNHPQADNESGLLSPLGASPSRRRRFGFSPFSASRTAPRPATSNVVALKPTANAEQADPIETPRVPIKRKHAARARRPLLALSVATVVVAVLVTTSFRADVAAYLKHYADRQDVTGTPDVPVTTQTVQAAESATAALRQSLQQERGTAEALAQDLASAHREIDKHAALAGKASDDAAQIKLAAESAATELRQSLQQERNKAEALAQDLATARREIETRTALANKAGDDAAQIKLAAESAATESRQSLQQERDRAEALAQSLATARREIETHTAVASKASDDAIQIKLAAESTTAELRQSLQQERGKAEALAQDLATARREIETHTAVASKASDDAIQIKLAAESTTAELRHSLQQERGKAEALAQDLATARREIETHAAVASKAADNATQIKLAAESIATELRQSLQQERGKAEALAQSLATAQREIDKHTALATKAGDDAAQIKRTAESTAAELRQSLQQERGKAEALATDLARARREMEMLAALTGKADDDAAKIKQALESTTAELRQSLQEERGRADALAQDLATARREIDKYATLESKADDDAARIKVAESTTAELRHSLQQERGKAEALAQTLARARREIDMYAALAIKASDDAARIKAAEATTAELRESLQEERDKAKALAQGLVSTRQVAAQRNAPEPTTVAQVKQVVETAAVEQPAAEPRDGPAVARLLARASALLNNGNIGAARIVLEHATAAGSARASFALAETYDPLVLATWGTYGTRGDPTRARELYAKAHAGGIKNAKERLNALQQ
jgi:DNA-binding ferritin-like protein (Dps family)